MQRAQGEEGVDGDGNGQQGGDNGLWRRIRRLRRLRDGEHAEDPDHCGAPVHLAAQEDEQAIERPPRPWLGGVAVQDARCSADRRRQPQAAGLHEGEIELGLDLARIQAQGPPVGLLRREPVALVQSHAEDRVRPGLVWLQRQSRARLAPGLFPAPVEGAGHGEPAVRLGVVWVVGDDGAQDGELLLRPSAGVLGPGGCSVVGAGEGR